MARKAFSPEKEREQSVYLSDGTKHAGGTAPDPQLGYIRCEWSAAGERCRFPGSISSSTRAGGPWFCSAHFRCRDPITGADIVEESRHYRQPSEQDKLAAQNKRAKAHLETIGLARLKGESDREHGERMRAWIRQRIRQLAAPWAAAITREPGEDREEARASE